MIAGLSPLKLPLTPKETDMRNLNYLLVDASMTMKFDLKPSGGAAVRFVPVEAKEAKGFKKYKGKILREFGIKNLQ